MAKVIATSLGYFGGELREAGSSFVLPDELWEDKERRPSWVRLAESTAAAEPFGGKGDHDGDGKPGGSLPGEASTAAKGKAGRKGKAETVQAPVAAEVFGDAPEPVRVVNEINDATGGTQPDWVAPTPVEA